MGSLIYREVVYFGAPLVLVSDADTDGYCVMSAHSEVQKHWKAVSLKHFWQLVSSSWMIGLLKGWAWCGLYFCNMKDLLLFHILQFFSSRFWWKESTADCTVIYRKIKRMRCYIFTCGLWWEMINRWAHSLHVVSLYLIPIQEYYVLGYKRAL